MTLVWHEGLAQAREKVPWVAQVSRGCEDHRPPRSTHRFMPTDVFARLFYRLEMVCTLVFDGDFQVWVAKIRV